MGVIMDHKHLANLRTLVKRLDTLLREKNQRNFNAFSAHFKKFMGELFIYYGRMEHHSDPRRFLAASRERRYFKKFPAVLAEVVRKGEDRVFLERCPFVPQLLRLYQAAVPGLPAKNFPVVEAAYRDLKAIIHAEEVLKPLNTLMAFSHAARGIVTAADVGRFFPVSRLRADPLIAISLLSAAIQKHIPYSKRDQLPYSTIPWRTLEVIGSRALSAKYGGFIQTHLPAIQAELVLFEAALQQIVDFERGALNVDQIDASPVQLPETTKVAGYIQDVTHLEEALNYLADYKPPRGNTVTNRYGVLRILCILGEVSKNLSPVIKQDSPFFKALHNSRDSIVHPQSFTVRQALRQLTYNRNDQRLLDFARDELPRILGYLRHVLAWRKTTQRFNQDDQLSQFAPHGMLAAPTLRSIADELRPYLLTRAERDQLLASLPAADQRTVSTQRQRIERILTGVDDLPRGYRDFKNYFTNLGMSNNKLKNIFAHLRQAQLIRIIKVMLNGDHEMVAIQDELAKLRLKKPLQHRLDSLLADVFTNHDQILRILDEHQANVVIDQQFIDDVLAKIPLTTINLVPIKKELADFILQREGGNAPSLHQLSNHLDSLGITDAMQVAQWQRAHKVLSGLELPSYAAQASANNNTMADTKQVTLLRHLDRLIVGIKRLSTLTKFHLLTLSPKASFRYFTENKALILDCEYAFSLFLDSAKALLYDLDELRDYNSPAAYSIFMAHPIDDIKRELEFYISHRNAIFHLSRLINRPCDTHFADIVRLDNVLEHFTVGTYFPEALSIGPEGVTTVPMRTPSLLAQCRALRDEVHQSLRTAAQPAQDEISTDMASTPSARGMWSAPVSAPASEPSVSMNPAAS